MKFLKKIFRLAAISWGDTMQYRADISMWILAEAATPLVSMVLWYTVAKNSDQGFSPQETLNYYILTILVMTATDSWAGFYLAQEILNGTIVQRLIKPIAVFWDLIINNAVGKVFRFLIPLPLFIVSLWLFPTFFVSTLYQWRPWFLFMVSLFLALCLAFFIDVIFGLFAFWLEDAVNIRWFKDTLKMITSGILIPIAIMPTSVQHIVNLLPFRHIITTPTEIILGRISGTSLLYALGIQLAWVVSTGIIVVVMWKRGLKRYAPPGQ